MPHSSAHSSSASHADLAELLDALAADAAAAELTHVQGRFAFIARLLRGGAMKGPEAVAELDRFTSERSSMARGALPGSQSRARLDEAFRLASLAADRLRFATLPEEGPGAVLVPLIREACERKLSSTRSVLERACRGIIEERLTPEVAASDLTVLVAPAAVLEGAELLDRAVLALAAAGGAS